MKGNHALQVSFTGVLLWVLASESMVCAQTASLVPTALRFSKQLIGTTSAAKVVTLTNTDSTTTLIINSISTSGDFAETDTCDSAVSPNSSCTISVTFTPTASGIRNGSLTVNDNSTTGTTQVVSLTGTCITALVKPTSLTYPSQLIQTMSPPKSVTLTNHDVNALTITSITSSGDFVQSNSCASSISAGGSCTVNVVFIPTAAGKRSGNLTFNDSASGSPQIANLSGVGTNPALVSLSVTPADRSVQIGQTRAFDAIGSFSDSSVANLTNSVIWNATTAGVATLSNNVATGVGLGQTSITATSGSVTGSASLIVSSVAVTPPVAVITLTQTQQFQSSEDVTWSVDGVLGGNPTTGTISAAGLYTPPSSTGSHQIVGTGQADQTQSGNASLQVTDYPSGTLTYSNDNSRTGQNLNETVLTPNNVTVNQFGKLFSFPVDGYVYAQPLYVENVNIAGQGQHNVVYVATEHDSVFAFDADGVGPVPLWQTSFINPPTTTTVPGKDIIAGSIGPEQGITGTPVIDPSSGTLYVAARVLVNNSKYQYYLHALDITSGAEKFGGPVPIEASVPGTGTGSSNGTLSFQARYEHNRAGLLLMNGVLYLGFGALDQEGSTVPYHHGWILAYDPQSLQLLGAYSTTPDAWGASIWQSGAGLGGDDLGNVFAMTGNGEFDGSDFGFSFVKVALSGGSLDLVDWFTPYNWNALLPDQDLGSGGPMLLPDQPGPHPHLILGAGKSGTIYLLDRDNMGQIGVGSDQIVQSIPHATSGIYSKPMYFQNLVWYVNGSKLLIFTLSNGLLTTPALSNKVNIGYPGATPVVSANASSNGIVWFLGTHGQQLGGQPAVLYAYDPIRGSQLYNSNQAGNRDVAGPAVKFTVPTIANGKVYIGTQNTVDVFGLLPQ